MQDSMWAYRSNVRALHGGVRIGLRQPPSNICGRGTHGGGTEKVAVHTRLMPGSATYYQGAEYGGWVCEQRTSSTILLKRARSTSCKVSGLVFLLLSAMSVSTPATTGLSGSLTAVWASTLSGSLTAVWASTLLAYSSAATEFCCTFGSAL